LETSFPIFFTREGINNQLIQKENEVDNKFQILGDEKKFNSV